MSDPVEALILDLLEWVGTEHRAYAEVMDAWRTSCPRLPVWEEANARGLLTQVHEAGREARVVVTSAGLKHLALARRRVPSPGAERRQGAIAR